MCNCSWKVTTTTLCCLTTLRTRAGKVQEGEPLKRDGTNLVLSRTEEETILKFIKELKYEAAVIDLDTIAALGRTVAESFRGPGLAPVLDRQWAANFSRRHKMGCVKKITTGRLPSTASDLVLDNKWRSEFLGWWYIVTPAKSLPGSGSWGASPLRPPGSQLPCSGS